MAFPPLADGMHLSTPFYLQTVESITGVTCDRADVLTGDPAWVPAAPLMTPVFVGFLTDVVPAPEGGISDFWWDSDLDGVDEAYSATVALTIYDAGFLPICTLTYEADNAIEVDPTQFVSASGALWRTWNVPLTNAETDCTAIDPAVYGTDNIQDILSGLPFVFGVGEMVDLVGPLQGFYGAYWPTIEPFFSGGYFSYDGLNAYELSYVQGIDVDDCLVLDDATELQPRTTVQAGWPVNLFALPVYVVPF